MLEWFKQNVNMGYYRRLCSNKNKLSLDKLMQDTQKLKILIEAAANSITSEIGLPINSFDVIVGVECAQKSDT